ncbi:TonB-dependent receptor [Hyphococcus luteus]|nr:TonB-dependent receptor [Marinicaulis flavus]
MKLKQLLVSTSLVTALTALAAPAIAQDAAGADDGKRRLDTITVTAQRRESTVQDSAIAVTGVTGDNLEKDRILNYSDLARSISSLSYTENSPLDQEFNIRGITNTRLDAPSSDQSVGIFIDDVYIGRSGLLNADFFDVDRVEVIRGPQGVLLGRNVVGGAISIYTAEPEFDFGGAFNAEFGNYDARLFNGHLTGEIAPGLAARISFQSRTRDGYNRDVQDRRDLDDLDSIQFRGQLLWEPSSIQDFRTKLSFDYMDDSSNGIHRVAIPTDPAAPGPWSAARALVDAALPGGLGVRDSLPGTFRFVGESFDRGQELTREAFGVTLDIEKGLGEVATFKSITAYRAGEAYSLYNQPGFGPSNPIVGSAVPLAFASVVNEDEEIRQFTQEVRLVSNENGGPFDWIIGAYLQEDDIDKVDRFLYEIDSPVPAFGALSGESNWTNNGENSNRAVFGQLGFQLSDTIHLSAGVRWSRDKKSGVASGRAAATGDRYNPSDPTPAAPLISDFTDVPYSTKSSELTPQATIEWKPQDGLLAYFTYSKGYKGGGFEDTPANATAATIAYDPETAQNFELGLKLELFDGRGRINTAGFLIDYKDLQVTQTDDGCLCNITDNAADARILGVETEMQFVVTNNLFLFGAATLLDTEYKDFVDSNGLVNTGNRLQRTPGYQFNVGAEVTTDFLGHPDALTLRGSYARQGKLYWLPDNFQHENPYGLLDARLTYAPEDQNYSLSLWGKNLTDKLYRTNIVAFFGDEVSTLGAPRTWGISLGYSF